MVPDANAPDDTSDPDSPDARGGAPTESGGAANVDRDGSAAGFDGDGAAVDFDEDALYEVIRAAVKDALLDVIGTLLLVGIGFVLLIAGGQALFGGSSASVVIGGVLIAAGVYVAGSALEVITPIREWA